MGSAISVAICANGQNVLHRRNSLPRQLTFFSCISLANASYTSCADGRSIPGKVWCKQFRMLSSTACCPDEVSSKITQHSASGSGVNCPWLTSVTRQSSMSPVNRIRKFLKKRGDTLEISPTKHLKWMMTPPSTKLNIDKVNSWELSRGWF